MTFLQIYNTIDVEPWRNIMDPHAYDGQAEIESIKQMNAWSKAKYFGAQIGAITGLMLFCIYKPLGSALGSDSTYFTIGSLGSIILAGATTFLLITATERIWKRTQRSS